MPRPQKLKNPRSIVAWVEAELKEEWDRLRGRAEGRAERDPERGGEGMRDYDGIILQVHEIFANYKNRHMIEDALRERGFALWGYLNDFYGRQNKDEQIWAYDVGVPNGQILCPCELD